MSDPGGRPPGGGPVWCIVLAAGAGERFGDRKVMVALAGRTVLERSLDAAGATCDGLVAVVPAGDPEIRAVAEAAGAVTAEGGATRSDSVRAGLALVPEDASVIVVHDAARPLAPASLFRAVVDEVVASGADGAVPALPLTDTVKRAQAGTVVETVDRGDLVAVQTPQAFRAGALRRAHASGADATDDAGLLEAIGATVRTVPGEPTNLKITRPADVAVAAAWLAEGPA